MYWYKVRRVLRMGDLKAEDRYSTNKTGGEGKGGTTTTQLAAKNTTRKDKKNLATTTAAKKNKKKKNTPPPLLGGSISPTPRASLEIH